MISGALGALTKTFGETVPDVAVILGSGFGAFTDSLENAKKLPYEKIPSFPKPTVPGHHGECFAGNIGKRRVLVFRGRFHYYEGHPLETVTLPVRVAGAWKIPHLAVTNAAGGVRKDFQPGSLMLIRDHINLLGASPLRGPNLDAFGPRFVDMTEAYDRPHRERALNIGKELGLDLPEGVYAALPGPSYETPSEIKMLSVIGADAVGMSTVPEVIVARHHGMRVLGISCITNQAAGISDQKISHEEVLENTKKAEKNFQALLRRWIEGL